MSGRRRAPLSPSLFPFLAVLVCTLGTLILLLALVANDAAEQTVAKAKAAQQQAAQQPIEPAEIQPPEGHPGFTQTEARQLIEEQQFRLTQLISFREAQTGDVESRRDKIAQVESHIDKLTDQLKALSAEIENALAPTTPEQRQTDQQAVADLQQKIEEETERIKRLEAKTGKSEPRVVIVPHKGPNGTARRPVYLECRADRLVIQPEGVTIEIDQLRNSSVGANPVESALRIIRAHALQVYGDTAPPYPLLVVRPDGIRTYRAARGALQDYDDQFGYELVTADLELALPPGDSNLKRQTEQGIAQAVSNQRVREQAIAARNRKARGEQGDSRRFPVLSASDLSRRGGRPIRSPLSSGNSGWSPLPGEAVSAARSHAQQRQTQFRGNPFATSSEPTSSHPRTTASESATGQLSNLDGSVSSGSAAPPELASSTPRTDSLGNSSQPAIAETNDFVGASEADSPASAGAFQLPSGNQQRDIDPHSLAQNGEGDHSESGRNSGSSASSESSQNTANQAPGGGSPEPGSQSFAAAADPNPNSQQLPPNSYSQRPLESLARPGTPGWGLPAGFAAARGNALVRIITAEAHADRLVLWPSRGGGTEAFGVFNNNVQRTMLELATAVRDRVEQWGAALPGARWQPTLEVLVHPGGEEMFARLQQLMRQSGIDVIARRPRNSQTSQAALPSPNQSIGDR